jgi:DeoR/GlpR family transcriptional regulator of sugar metabolism
MMRQSRETIVVADSSKIGIVTSALTGPISEVHVLVTDARATDKAIARGSPGRVKRLTPDMAQPSVQRFPR